MHITGESFIDRTDRLDARKVFIASDRRLQIYDVSSLVGGKKKNNFFFTMNHYVTVLSSALIIFMCCLLTHSYVVPICSTFQQSDVVIQTVHLSVLVRSHRPNSFKRTYSRMQAVGS